MLPNGAVYEQVKIGQTTQYAIKTDKGVQVRPFLEVGEHIVYQPLTPSPWMLPPKPIPYGTVEDLWKEIKEFTWDHLDIEDKALYDVYVAWIIASWIPEKYDSTGYLHFHGTRNSGKTRGLDVLNFLCFRPLLSPSASGATVFRALDAFHPTFLLDEFEMYEKQKESKAEVIGILNAGYRRGQVVLRMTGMKEGVPTIKGFRVFGPKALSSIEKLPSALESRCIRFPMTRTFRKIRRMIDKERADIIRGKLLQYRFNHDLEEPFSDGNPIDLPDGRLIEMFYPLEAIAPTEEIKRTILQCARNQYNASINEERATITAYVFHTIISILRENPRLMIPQTEIRLRYSTEYFNGVEIKPQTMGGWLKTMGFKSEWVQKLKTCLVVDVDKLEKRKNRYVLAEEMDEIDKVLASVRSLKDSQTKLDATVATVLTVSTPMGEIPQTVAGQQEEHKTVKTVNSIETVNTVNTIETVADSSLQEKMDFIYGELTGSQDGLSTSELAEKVGVPFTELDKVLAWMERENRIFRPRPDFWKATQ